MTVDGRIRELKARVETRRAVEAMAKVIESASLYLFDHPSSGVIRMFNIYCVCGVIAHHVGNIFGAGRRDELNEMTAEFARAKEAFDRSLQLEIFKAVDGIGQSIHIRLYVV